jgi:hypothetical protein
VPVHTFGDAQSELEAHVVLHAAAPQMYGVQGVVVPAWQVPAPLQVRAELAVVPVQLAAAHCVPDAYRRQPPEPSQKPSVMQPAAPASVHWFKGSCPAGTLVHVPMLPLSAHDLQFELQAVAQQTPWAHTPLVHSLPAAQAVPFVFFVHTPPLQMLGLLQSALVVHEVLHALVPHTNGSQLEVLAAWQVPVPLQVRVEDSVTPVQLAAAHCVPEA